MTALPLSGEIQGQCVPDIGKNGHGLVNNMNNQNTRSFIFRPGKAHFHGNSP